MKRCIIVPDSFKGSLTSLEICRIAKDCIAEFFPDCETIAIPVADGGEGTVDCFVYALGGVRVETEVQGPLGETIHAVYGRCGDNAVIETAAAAGLPLVYDRRDPKRASTYGVGQQILGAVTSGAKRTIIGLGGSCTNDGGCGCAAALGVEFFDKDGRRFVPTGGTLRLIDRIDLGAAAKRLEGVDTVVLGDTDIPLYGERGAACVFAPQKGADPDCVRLLDDGLRHLARVIERDIGVDLAELPGGGAAGGFGAGCAAFLGGRLRRGIDVALDVLKFDELLDGADVVFTGEGRIDAQSMNGKAVGGVGRRAARKGVPVFAVVGDIKDDAYCAYNCGVTAIYSINRQALPMKDARLRSRQDYIKTFKDILRGIKAAESFAK